MNTYERQSSEKLRKDEPFVLESSNRPEMDDVARSLLYVIRIY